jgi:hypothetical protein
VRRHWIEHHADYKGTDVIVADQHSIRWHFDMSNEAAASYGGQ